MSERYLFDGPEGPGCHAPVDGKAVGARLKDARLDKGWVLQNLAERSGTTQEIFVKAEEGRGFSLVNLVRIANALGASLDYILYGEGAP